MRKIVSLFFFCFFVVNFSAQSAGNGTDQQIFPKQSTTDSLEMVDNLKMWKAEIENIKKTYGENEPKYKNQIINVAFELYDKAFYSLTLSFLEPFHISLSKLYGTNSEEYINLISLIANSYMNDYYFYGKKVKWVEDFFDDAEKELNELNPNFYDMTGYCALIKQINNKFRDYIQLMQRQLKYAQDHNLDSFNSNCSLMYGYIRNNQLQEGLKIMEVIDKKSNIPIEQKLEARNNLLNALLSNNNNSRCQTLYVDYADKYINDFAQHNYENTKHIIQGMFSFCFETDKYTNMDKWVKIYENFPNTSLKEKESLYYLISVFASTNKLWDIALKYRIESLKLCDEINDDILLWDGTGTNLKIENLGWLYGQLGDCQKEIAYYKEGLKIRERITGKINEGYVFQLHFISNLIKLCFIDYDSSLEFELEALGCVEKLYGKNSFKYYNELLLLGSSYMECHNFEKALECYNLCSEFYKEKKENEKLDNIQLLVSKVYSNKGDFGKSIEILISLEQKVPKSSKLYINVIHNLAVSYSNVEDRKQSLYWYLIEEKILSKQTNEDISSLISLYSDVGNTYSDLNEFEKAEYYFKKGLSKIQNLSDYEINLLISQIVILYNNYSILYVKKGNLKSADAILTQLETFYKERNINNSNVYAHILKQKADFYTDIYSYDEAIKYYDKAWSVLKEFYRSKNLSTTYQTDATALINNMAVLLSNIGQYGESIEMNKLLLETREETIGTSHPDYITTLNNIAMDYSYMDSIQQAKYYIEEVLQKTPDNPIYLNNAGSIFKKNDNFLSAENFYLKAKIIAETRFGKEHPDYLRPLFNIFTLYFEYKEFDIAIPFLNEYGLSIRKQVFNNFSFMSETQREQYWNTVSLNLNYYYPLLSAYPTPETQQLAYNEALFSKGLLLRSTNEIRNAIMSSGNQSLINQYEEIRTIRQQINALQSNPDNYNLDSIQTLETKADSLDKALTIASSDYRDMKADLNIEWNDVRNKLSNNEVAIEFIDYQRFDKQWTDTTMYAALLLRKDSNSPEFVPLFEQSQLSQLLSDKNPVYSTRIQKLYNAGNPRSFNGQKLYNLIWKPLEKYLDGVETVYYSPAGLLNRISFAALSADTLCLTDKYNLHLVSSTREIVNRDKKQTALLPIKQVVEYGGIQYDIKDTTLFISYAQKYKKSGMLASRSLPDDSTRSGSWDYLQGTASEVNAIQKLLQESKVPNVKYMCAKANEESFKALSGNSPELLHIATHGFFLENEKQIRENGFMQMMNSQNRTYVNPLLWSGLLFAGANHAWTNKNVISGIEDGILTAEEIANLDLSKTKLVVLSACETGLGEVKNAEGVFGLQRAFKLAGVETLVMSLWSVDDTATSQFMLAFYQNLLAGKSKLESFKIAQNKIREQYKNPYYWAAFVMMD